LPNKSLGVWRHNQPTLQGTVLGVVYVTGVVKNRGSNIRILNIKTLVQAPTPGPVAVAQLVTETVAA
jgi:hypothetical protein